MWKDKIWAIDICDKLLLWPYIEKFAFSMYVCMYVYIFTLTIYKQIHGSKGDFLCMGSVLYLSL